MNFDEPSFIKLIFFLSDIRSWVEELEKTAFSLAPITDKKKLFRQNYYLTASTLAHIIERHYYKISRHPQTGKFHISIIEILHLLREAKTVVPVPVPGCSNLQYIWHTNAIIGFDRSGNPCSVITVITNPGGTIITAFPGLLASNLPNDQAAKPAPLQQESLP